MKLILLCWHTPSHVRLAVDCRRNKYKPMSLMSCRQRSKGKGERRSKDQTPQHGDSKNPNMSVMRGKSEEMKQNGISLHPLDMAAASEPELLCIFGPRDLGRSLGLRLLQSGYGVVYGSRRPHSCGPLLQGAQVHITGVGVFLSKTEERGETRV